jgi:hypothetical protein
VTLGPRTGLKMARLGAGALLVAVALLVARAASLPPVFSPAVRAAAPGGPNAGPRSEGRDERISGLPGLLRPGPRLHAGLRGGAAAHATETATEEVTPEHAAWLEPAPGSTGSARAWPWASCVCAQEEADEAAPKGEWMLRAFCVIFCGQWQLVRRRPRQPDRDSAREEREEVAVREIARILGKVIATIVLLIQRIPTML